MTDHQESSCEGTSQPRRKRGAPTKYERPAIFDPYPETPTKIPMSKVPNYLLHHLELLLHGEDISQGHKLKLYNFGLMPKPKNPNRSTRTENTWVDELQETILNSSETKRTSEKKRRKSPGLDLLE